MKIIKDQSQQNITAQQGQLGGVEQAKQIQNQLPVDISQQGAPITCPLLPGNPINNNFKPLNPAQLAEVAGVGGAGLKGSGALSGILSVENGHGPRGAAAAFLTTANHGLRSAVRFQLDVSAKDAKAFSGQQINVSGNITKTNDYRGTISGVKLEAPTGYQVGSYKTLSGTIQNERIMGIGGEAPPSGAYLHLPENIEIAGKQYGKVFLGNREFQDGQTLDLHGRLDVNRFGGVEVLEGTYLQLSGLSNVSAGEPRYVNGKFETVDGKKAPRLMLERRDIFDASNVIMVLDQGADKAFVGLEGGMQMAGANAFHGFKGDARIIANATDADRQAIQINREGTPINAAGQELDRVGGHADPAGVADGMLTSWYYDKAADTAYRFLSGGVAGFQMHMDQVIRPN